ncbi:MAG: hypothetical protein UR61_C0065G0003 [candidate division WS6 bacterium GW2011_GWE1_34_7]|uniref:Uncharacterized protein n=2 Tax=Bacteria candidate phyla TaxID=1783234 RepID=A0A0G0E8U2_9BACT|nr:MAG: hypothetical protein UR61_C0065G0003 [candidate division WS6 bacterium GW2011_GWE1_34_7]OGM80524.1 MAG: hypothetical protein A2393_01575 [Candidatus Woesebacteria bacterium RIFOXYB1_FULL_41_13]
MKFVDDVPELIYQSGDSKALREALYKSGEKGLGQGLDAAHHIVAGGSRFAEKTREILKKFGVGINDAVNGAFLE